MALIKYTGKDNVVVTLNGERKLIKPNKIFSGPESFKTYENFEVIGFTKQEKERTGKRTDKSLKLEIRKYFTPFVDFDVLDENGAPKISICIVTKDGKEVIKRCVESIFEHVKYHDFEILLCDTGTTDIEVKELYQDWSALYGKKIKIYTDQEYNFSKNNNFLASKASGDVLLFLNNDVFMTYDAVSEMFKYSLCSNIGCVGHRLVWDRTPDEIQHDGQLLYNEVGRWIGPGHYNYQKKINEVSDENVRVEGVTAACLMVRKTLFNKFNGFDEEYKDIYQDVDFNLKVCAGGYDNFCVRKKALLHVDHATRVNDQTKDSPKDFMKFQTDWISKGSFPVRNKAGYSILVCATNKKQLKIMFESIKTREDYEFIYLNNSANFLWSAEALNVLSEVSVGNLMFWMHQDVTFDGYEPFASTTDMVTKIGGSFGIMGPAGIQVGGKGAIRGVDFSSLKYNFDFLRVQTLDEFCLISQRKNKLVFGEYLDDFHFYGADICCQALKRGLNNYVIKLPITHHSGGDVNLKKRGGYEAYMKQGKKFLKKWKKDFPFISTTTMHFKNDNVVWYLGKLLGLQPNEEMVDFNKIDDTPNHKKYLETSIDKYLKKDDGVSIVILNKDKPEYIKKCINNIDKYISDPNVEIIIGDTGTTNKEVLDLYEGLGDRYKVVDVGDYHFSKNNNLITNKHVKYNRVLFMNNDVFVNSNIISKMKELMRSMVGIVGVKMLYENGTVQHAGVEMVISKDRNPNEWYLPEHIDYKKENSKKENEIVDCVTGACLMIATELFLEFGGFDEKFNKVFQDVDLCLKVRREGYKSMCCNEVWATHVESGTRDPKIDTLDYNLMTERWGRVKY